MVYVITGATSFIGIELIYYLLERNHKVFAVCRSNSNTISSLPEGAEVVTADMSDYGSLKDKIPFADVFINLAWGGTGHDRRDVVEIQNENIKFTTEAFYSACKMKCKLFVEAGSQAEYGSTTKVQSEDDECIPFSEYGKAKLRVKEELFSLSEILNIKYIHLRIFSVFGENDHPWTLVMSTMDKMLNNEVVDLSPCTQNWNFLYVKDAVRQIVTLCDYAISSNVFKHEIYNIASDDSRQLKNFVERIKKLVDSTSILNYGVVIPHNQVSLQPNMNKTKSIVRNLCEYSFDNVITRILETKKEYL